MTRLKELGFLILLDVTSDRSIIIVITNYRRLDFATQIQLA